jgi:hypothetical protein
MLSPKRYLPYALIFVILSYFMPLYAQSGLDSAADPGTDPGKAESKSEPAQPSSRLFGVFPNYRTADGSRPFLSLTDKQKLSIAAHDSFDWPLYLTAGVLTLADRSHDPVYGIGVVSFGNQYARWSANQIVGNMLTEGFFPVALHQDPRYFRKGGRSFSSRLFGALGQIVVARNDSGRREFNTSEWVGNAVATGIANAYTPHMNSWSDRMQAWGWMIGGDALSNVFKEFGPDIRKRLPLNHPRD